MNLQIALLAALAFVFTGCATTSKQDMSKEQAAQFVDETAAKSSDADPAATAAESADAESEKKVASATTEQEWICRRERMTGTHYMVKICRPRYKIDEDMRKTQENMRDMQRSASNSGPIGN